MKRGLFAGFSQGGGAVCGYIPLKAMLVLLLSVDPAAVWASIPPAAAAAKPNIVVIMADDLGWMDLHCYVNAQIETPYLDQLAEEGMRFTDAYAASPVCSPTRGAMMTGLAPGRLRLTNHVPGNPEGFSLDPARLAEEAIAFVTESREEPFFLSWWKWQREVDARLPTRGNP